MQSFHLIIMKWTFKLLFTHGLRLLSHIVKLKSFIYNVYNTEKCCYNFEMSNVSYYFTNELWFQ